MSDTQSFSTSSDSSHCVVKRNVFYLSGFDPRGASFYHRLYKEESAKQASLLNAEIKVGPRSRQDKHVNHWIIKSNFHHFQPPQIVETDYFFLNWDDIIRAHWEPSLYKLIFTSFINYWRYYRCGAFAKIRQYYKKPFLSALYPWLYLILLTIFSLLFGYSVAEIVSHFMPSLFIILFAIVAVTASFLVGLKLGNHLGVFWLLRTYNFVAQQGFNNSVQLRGRIDYFTDFIKKTILAQPADENLLIGHSVGSIFAIHLLASFSIQNPTLARQLKLVTLGQCIPLLAGMPQATLFHQHLEYIENQHPILWIDYLARADSLGFLREDGVSNSLLIRPSTKIVRFFKMFSAQKYKKIQRNKLKLHFLYIMATDILGDYDYFSLTVGSKEIAVKS